MRSGLRWRDQSRGSGALLGFADVLVELDRHLGQRNIEYQAKRESVRLGPPRWLALPAGTWQRWDAERLRGRGGAPEQYKHPCLIGDVEFRATMPVERVVEIG